MDILTLALDFQIDMKSLSSFGTLLESGPAFVLAPSLIACYYSSYLVCSIFVVISSVQATTPT